MRACVMPGGSKWDGAQQQAMHGGSVQAETSDARRVLACQTVANGASFSSKEAFMCGLDPFVAASRVCHAVLQRSLASLQRNLASLQRSLASSRTT
jgi:hypothetical protein